ncbi:hypothetical protein JQ616_19065 [Bradyrhizobium tropiciagri]|uniref:hypothetical protein n=1 Tax=Bradyrhizobium tropiciagri TaxID=312253 RepID=UPI001BADBBD4|nr:hypothetical protein [Bradyrhizobium tropiciagri]MBR0897061.1 hypothetical protein [Bradyrhizobium tropiciagri]
MDLVKLECRQGVKSGTFQAEQVSSGLYLKADATRFEYTPSRGAEADNIAGDGREAVEPVAIRR